MVDIPHSSLSGSDLHPSKISIISGAPASTPTYIGQSYWDQVNKKLYVAIGTTSASDWTTTSPSSLTIANTATVTLSFTGLGALKADVNTGSLTLTSSQITDLSTSISSNTDVAANTAARHNALTLWTSGGFSPTSSVNGLQIASGQILRLSQDLSSSGTPTFASATLGGLVMDNQSAVVLRELTSNGTDAVSLRAAADTNAYTITLPASAPSAGTTLTYDGTNYTWASAGSGNTGSETITNNVAAPQSLSSLLFNGASIRSVTINYSVYRSTDTNEVAENGTLRLIYKTTANTWLVNQVYNGEASGVVFTVTSAGQIQYTSDLITGTGYVGVLKYSYTTTAV